MDEYLRYQSPFSWRYGSQEMREIWGELNKRRLWREIWVTLAEVQVNYQLVTEKQVEELRSKVGKIDLPKSLKLEEEIHHDLMAELQVFASQCPSAGGILHLGATSMDIKDNAITLQIKESLNLIRTRLQALLLVFADFITGWAEFPVIGFTHLQPAEPTTLGYRFAQPAQDLLSYLNQTEMLINELKGKGFCGAVGTSASFESLLGRENLPEFQALMGKNLKLQFFDVVTQTYPRIQDYQVLSDY